MTHEEFETFLKARIVEAGITGAEASALAGMYPPNFTRKLKNGTFFYIEVVNLAEKLGYEVVWKKEKSK